MPRATSWPRSRMAAWSQNLLQLLEVVAGDDQRAAALARLDELPHLVRDARVEAGGGLVEEHHARVPQEGLRQADALGHAVGEGVAGRLPPVAAVDLGEDLLGGAAGVGRGHALQAGEVDEELAHALAGGEQRVLREDADLALELGDGVRRAVEDEDLAPGRRQVAGEHREGGGLAGAVGADEAEDAALRHLEGDVVDGGEGAERARHALEIDGGGRLLAEARLGLGRGAVAARLGQRGLAALLFSGGLGAELVAATSGAPIVDSGHQMSLRTITSVEPATQRPPQRMKSSAAPSTFCASGMTRSCS